MSKRGPHKCIARHCRQIIGGKLLFCYDHWSMIPKDLQQQLYDGRGIALGRSIIAAQDHIQRLEDETDAYASLP